MPVRLFFLLAIVASWSVEAANHAEVVFTRYAADVKTLGALVEAAGLKSLLVSKTLLEEPRPNPLPLTTSTGDESLVDLAKIDETKLSAGTKEYLRAMLERLAEEIGRVRKAVPFFKDAPISSLTLLGKRDSFYERSSAFPDLVPSDFADLPVLRAKLMEAAFVAAGQHNPTTDAVKKALKQPDSFPNFHPLADLMGGAFALAHHDVARPSRLFVGDELVGEYSTRTADAAFFKKSDPELSQLLERRAIKRRLKRLGEGCEQNVVQSDGIARAVTALVRDWDGKDGRKRWLDFLSEHVSSPSLYAFQEIKGEKHTQLVPSAALAMDAFEKTLKGAEKTSFQELRTKRNLTTRRILDAELADRCGRYTQTFKSIPGGDVIASAEKRARYPLPETMPKDLRHVKPEEAVFWPTEDHEYEVGRGFLEYAERMGAEFQKDLARLGPKDLWIDMGSGEGIAIDQFRVLDRAGFKKALKVASPHLDDKALDERLDAMPLTSLPVDKRPRVMGITYKMERKVPKGLVVLKDRLFSEIKDEEIPSAKLITDYFGILSYDPQVDEVVRRFARILQPSGKAYWVGTGAMERSRVKRKDGKVVPLTEWIGSLPGLTAKSERGVTVIEITGKEVSVPKLKLTFSDAETPPTRFYVEE